MTFVTVAERTRWLHATVVATIVAMAVLQSAFLVNGEPESASCEDDPNLKHGGKDHNCEWVKEKPYVRCFLEENGNGPPLAESCRETCDYQYCKTIARFSEDKLYVGAYYYPWHDGNFHGGKYLRNQLIEPQQFPKLGEYDDREASVIEKHLKWSRDSNIGLWVTSWWGEGKREDLNIKNNILVHPSLGDHKISIFYETNGRIKESNNYTLDLVKPDLEYLCGEFFNHPNYFTMGIDADGNSDATSETRLPVLYVYLTRKLANLGILNQTLTLMREGARDAGCGEIFIVGDQVFQGPPNNEAKKIPFELLDAVTNYDVYGSMQGGKQGGYIGGKSKVFDYYDEQNEWKTMAKDRDCAYIPAVSPGFNDRGVRPEVERVPLSRRLKENKKEGSLFKAALQAARRIVDSDIGNLIMVNSFNEWHEDTQIEPCLGVDKDKSSTNLPLNLTYGLEYEGYNAKYLKLLKKETDKWDPSMVIPPVDVEFAADEGLTTVEEIETISDYIWDIE